MKAAALLALALVISAGDAVMVTAQHRDRLADRAASASANQLIGRAKGFDDARAWCDGAIEALRRNCAAAPLLHPTRGEGGDPADLVRAALAATIAALEAQRRQIDLAIANYWRVLGRPEPVLDPTTRDPCRCRCLP